MNSPKAHPGDRTRSRQRFATGSPSPDLYASRVQGVNSFQCPSEMTSTVPPVTLMAVWSSIAYPGTGTLPAHFSAPAMEFSGIFS